MQKGRQIVIGDVHGELDTLKCLVASLNLKPQDQLVFLGDIVDKGPKTKQTIDYLIDIQSKHDCVFVKGNHEIFMLMGLNADISVRDIWLKHGGRETLLSYGVNPDGEDPIKDLQTKVPSSHVVFLKKMVRAYETKTHVFTHAGWDTSKALEEQSRQTLCFLFMNEARPTKGFKEIICGHSSIMTGKPARKGNILCIDTIEYGWLTAYDVKGKNFVQVNKQGQIRLLKDAEVFSEIKHVPKQFHK